MFPDGCVASWLPGGGDACADRSSNAVARRSSPHGFRRRQGRSRYAIASTDDRSTDCRTDGSGDGDPRADSRAAKSDSDGRRTSYANPNGGTDQRPNRFSDGGGGAGFAVNEGAR